MTVTKATSSLSQHGINFKSSNVTFSNQVAQNAYYDIIKRAPTTALFRAQQKCCLIAQG